ncbi:CpaF family protein, partial [Vibrio parahaemolyticus]|nr:CpaF family protein [Vibrio parahaemolyticus]
MSSNKEVYSAFRAQIFEALDVEAIQSLARPEIEGQIRNAVDVLATNFDRPVTSMMKASLVKSMLDELFGLGPIQPLVDDKAITDIMVNGPNNVFYEKHGKLEKSDITFIDED